ncbi:MAG: lyase family protein [Patescibacteria group bacterium]|nr:lyase family protein [Patescibacteria group bacterium]
MHPMLEKVIKEDLPKAAQLPGRILFMPGDGRYQPEALKPFLGYDMWASWLIIVEWFWLMTLAKTGVIPKSHKRLLTHKLLWRLLAQIPTTAQDNREYGRDGKKGTNHDILALLELMRPILPKELRRFLHFCPTSYCIIDTAYALMLQQAFARVYWPKLQEVDQAWREKIRQYAEVVQAGRTHLQTALPVTVGFWLAVLHSQFADSAFAASSLASQLPGKFTGAVGTSAALIAILKANQAKRAQETMEDFLGLPLAQYTTQIVPPQPAARFYHELELISGVLANLGGDVRLLQSSQFGEIVGASSVDSSSSTMAHKKANPVGAEKLGGMHTDIVAERMKVTLTLTSDLQRDLRGSSPKRSQSAVMVYGYEQATTAVRLLKSLAIDPDRINANFQQQAKLVVAELLHLCLQRQGYENTHALVNQEIVPLAANHKSNLNVEMLYYLSLNPDKKLQRAWSATPKEALHLFAHPKEYIGNAIQLAQAETTNTLGG